MFTITLKNALGAVTPALVTTHVSYADQAGTAFPDRDYVSREGQLIFHAGETAKRVFIKILGDPSAQLDRAFSLVLSSPDGALLSTATTGVCVISTAP